MRRIALVSVAALGLALVGARAAPAKEVSELQICGTAGCKTITDRDLLVQYEQTGGSTDFVIGPSVPAPYFTLRVTVDAGEAAADGATQSFTWTAFYVPGARALRTTGDPNEVRWTRMTVAQKLLLSRFAGDLEPFPVPAIARATVGGKPAANPGSYLNLYRLKKTKYRYPTRSDWKRIRLYSDTASPWTDSAARLAFSPSTRTLDRGGFFTGLSKSVARSVRKASAVRVPAESKRGRSSHVVALAVAIPVAALALLTAGRVLLRR